MIENKHRVREYANLSITSGLHSVPWADFVFDTRYSDFVDVYEGGLGYMIIISVFLILLLLAAWKAPRWVKEIGIGALVVSAFATLLGLLQVFDVLQRFGDVSTAVLCGGLKVLMIPFFYGLIVYFISLVIRVIQKPRI